MTQKFTLTGGARIGMANATYPFADLYADREILKINASIIGNLVFRPGDIVSIKPYSSMPIIGNGIKINHRVENYSSEVIFWTFKNPNAVIREIEKTGFLQNTDSEIRTNHPEILQRQHQGGFPMKKSAAVFYIVVWNLLFLSDIIPFFQKGDFKGQPLGPGMSMALGFMFASSILAIVSEKFRRIILKQDREFDDIKKFAYFLAFISGTMFISFTMAYLNK